MNSTNTKIFIANGNIAYNRGDRINFSAQIELLQSTLPTAEISGSSFQHERDCKWYNIEIVRQGKYFLSKEERKKITEADIVIWGGGALLADNSCMLLIPFWAVQILYIRLILRKPVMAWAHGIVINTLLGKLIARIPLYLCSAITVRDSNSKQAVCSLSSKICNKTIQTADPAILISKQQSSEVDNLIKHYSGSGSKKVCVISPTFWPFYYKSTDILPYLLLRRFSYFKNRNAKKIQQYLEGLTSTIDHLVNTHDMNVVLCPHYPDASWEDTQYLQQLQQSSQFSSRVFVESGDRLSPKEYAYLWSHMDLAMTISLHQATVAVAMNVPCIQFYYEPKGKDFFKDLDLESYLLDWKVLFDPKELDQISTKIHHAIINGQHDFQAASTHFDVVRNKAIQNVTVLQKVLH